MKKENVILEKSFSFSLHIIELYKSLQSVKKEYVYQSKYLGVVHLLEPMLRRESVLNQTEIFYQKCLLHIKKQEKHTTG